LQLKRRTTSRVGLQIVAPSNLRDAARKIESSQREEREALEKSAPDFGQTLGQNS
jgi:hypothetical protein